jgi:polyether ionophore transport system permease protein
VSELTGTGTLVRAMLRRDRVRMAVWVASLAGLVVMTAGSVKGLYPTQQDLNDAARTAEDSAAAIAFNGPPYALDTLGGQIVFQVGSFGFAMVGLMALLMLGRNTRGEEEAQRTELGRAASVGRYAPTAAALVSVTAMSLAVGVVVALGLLAYGLPAGGSVLFGASFAAFGIFFAAVTAVTAQVTENTRVAYGLAGVVLGASYLVRAVGDMGDGALSWLSPMGIVQYAKPFAGDRWWPLLIVLVLAVGLVGVAAALATRRDLGAGLVPPRPGPPVAGRWLSGPLGLAVRLQRGTVLAWSAGLFLGGVAYGSIGNDVEEFVADTDSGQELIARFGGDLVDSYLATALLVLALVASGFAISSVHRLRSEETAGRAEPLLATRQSRWRWTASHLAVAFGGSLVVIAAGGLGTGLSYGIAVGDAGEIPRLLAASLAYAPATGVLAGGAMALFGLVPRAVLAVWGALALFLVAGMLGSVLNLPGWVLDLSPFEQVPHVPAADFHIVPLAVITALAAGLTAVGLVGFRERDLTG